MILERRPLDFPSVPRCPLVNRWCMLSGGCEGAVRIYGSPSDVHVQFSTHRCGLHHQQLQKRSDSYIFFLYNHPFSCQKNTTIFACFQIPSHPQGSAPQLHSSLVPRTQTMVNLDVVPIVTRILQESDNSDVLEQGPSKLSSEGFDENVWCYVCSMKIDGQKWRFN